MPDLIWIKSGAAAPSAVRARARARRRADCGNAAHGGAAPNMM
jgi:hypothetical protein